MLLLLSHKSLKGKNIERHFANQGHFIEFNTKDFITKDQNKIIISFDGKTFLAYND